MVQGGTYLSDLPFYEISSCFKLREEKEEKVLMPAIIYLKTWWKGEGQKLLEISGSLTLSPADWSTGTARLVFRCSLELWACL